MMCNPTWNSQRRRFHASSIITPAPNQAQNFHGIRIF